MIFTILLQGCVQGQSIQQSEHIIPLSLGAYRIKNTSSFTPTLRPASGTWTPKKAMGIYAENRFMLRQLADMQGMVNIPVHSALLSFSGHYRGTRFLSTQSIGTGLGLKLSPRLSTGIRISSHWMKISSISPIHAMVVEGGLIHNINEKVLWGVHIRKKINTNNMQKTSVEKPQLIAGIGYTLNKHLFLAYEFSAASTHQMNSAVGLEWWATDKIHFRAGLNKPLSELYITAGKKGKREMVSIGLSSHALLGYSGALLLEYEFQ